MATTKIKLKKSSVPTNAPSTGDLDYGELAINYADGRLYYKNSSNVIKNFIDSDRVVSQIAALSGGGGGDGLDSAAVLALFSGGTGVTYNGSGQFSIGQAVGTGDSVSFAGLIVDSDTLYVDTVNDRVGIGTTTPSNKLTVIGDISNQGDIYTTGNFYSFGQSTGSSFVKLGNGRTGDGYAYIDMIGDTTYTGYGLRIIRNNTGANASSDIQHRGTSALRIQALDAAPVTLSTTSAERVRVTATGNVGIGTSTPSQPLHVAGAIKTTSGLLFGSTESYMYENDSNSIAWRIGGDGPYFTMSDGGSSVVNLFNVSAALALGAANSEKMRITSAGYILIGRTDTTLGGGAGYDLQIGSGSTNSGMTFHAGTTSLSDIQFADGTVGNASYRGLIRYDHNGDYMGLWTAASEKVRLGPNGQIGLSGANYGTAGQVLTSGGSGAATTWSTITAGATGGGSDQVFWENGQTVTTNYTITDGKNAMSAGPILIESGVTVTVGDGEVWTVV